MHMYPFSLEPLSIFSPPPYSMLDIPLISLEVYHGHQRSLFPHEWTIFQGLSDLTLSLIGTLPSVGLNGGEKYNY